MEKRQDPLEGFDWVFKPEPANPPPDMDDDSFARLVGPGPTMHDLDPIAEIEPAFQQEPSLVVQALREHPRIRRVAVRTGLAMSAIITGVTAAFITHTSATSTEALPQRTSVSKPSASPERTDTTTPKIPSKKRSAPSVSSSDMTPVGFIYTPSASPTFIPRTFAPTPTASETVDATSRPPTSSAPSTEMPSETCTPSTSPSATAIESPSPIASESPSESPTEVETTFAQTEMPQASQSPALGD